MLKQIDLLINIQNIEEELNFLNETKEKIPLELKKFYENQKIILNKIENLNKELELIEKDKKTKDKDLLTENDHIIKLQNKTREIKTNKEYTALLQEIEFAKNRITEIEDKQLENLESIEEKKKTILIENQILLEENKKIESKKKEIEKQVYEINDSIQEKIKNRESIVSSIESDYLQIYSKISKNRQGNTVVEILNGVCNGCFLSIPPQLENEIKQSQKIIQCPHCQRILFYKNN